MDGFLFALTLFAALGCGIVAGVFFAFSAFVMRALACGALVVSSLLAWGEPFAAYLLAGGAFYLVGTIGPTGVYHVPRNEALATVEPRGAGAEDHWSRYLRGWTVWNHLRFAAALAASATLVIALRIG